MGEKYEGKDVVNVRLSSIEEPNPTKAFAMWMNKSVAASLSKENVSFDRENAPFKKNTSIRFEEPSALGRIIFQFRIRVIWYTRSG